MELVQPAGIDNRVMREKARRQTVRGRFNVQRRVVKIRVAVRQATQVRVVRVQQRDRSQEAAALVIAQRAEVSGTVDIQSVASASPTARGRTLVRSRRE